MIFPTFTRSGKITFEELKECNPQEDFGEQVFDEEGERKLLFE